MKPTCAIVLFGTLCICILCSPNVFSQDTWTQLQDFPSDKVRIGATSFTVNNKVIVYGGYNAGPKADYFIYDINSNSWLTGANPVLQARYYAVSFAINGKGTLAQEI